MTQGESLDDLKEYLRDVYRDLVSRSAFQPAAGRTRGAERFDHGGITSLKRGVNDRAEAHSFTAWGFPLIFRWSTTFFHHIRITLTETNRGDPFLGGLPVIINAFADGNAAPFFSYVRTNGFTNNYIFLIGEAEGIGGDGVVRHFVDNRAISLQPLASPALTAAVSGNVGFLSWPTFAPLYRPYQTADLTPPVIWSPLTNPVENEGANFKLTFLIDARHRFFQLR
jgi:hypothetical protein